MAEPASLDNILDDKTPASPAEPAAPAAPPPPEAPPATGVAAEAPEPEKGKRQQWREKELDLQAEGLGMERDPVTGQFTKKADAPPEKPKEPEKPAVAPAAPPAEEMTAKEKAAFAAVHDERRKRQGLEQEIARLRQATPPAAPGEPKSFWDDPEGALKRAKEDVTGVVMNVRLSTSEQIARSKYQDFDQNIDEFAKILESTPSLHAQWLNSPDPAEFAYRLGKNNRQLQEAGSLDAITEKVRKETEVSLRTKWDAEQKAKEEALERQRRELPPSLSDTRGSAPGSKPVWGGPPPLADILKP